MLNLNKPILQLSRHEQSILHSSGPQDFRSLLSGTCRVARLSRSYSDHHRQVIWDTSTDVIGPTFFFFIWWTLRCAQQQNIKRLYFLARDGHILIQIAQKIIEKYNIPIECRYLHGSRQAWLIPSIRSIDRSELSWIFSDWWYKLSVESVCKRLSFTPSQAKDVLVQYGFDEHSWDKPLNKEGENKLKDCFKSHLFGDWFQSKIITDFNNITGYFKQEGVWEACPFGLVDIGWLGNQQYTFNKILDKCNHLPHQSIKGFYLGITEAVKKYPKDQLFGFLFDLSRSRKRISLRNNHLYEVFAACDQRRTAHFDSKDGKFFPVFSPLVPKKVIDWGIALQQEGILEFCSMMIANCPSDLFKEEYYYPALEKILNQFINKPSSGEAQIYGQFPIDGEMTESNLGQIAPRISRKQFWTACLNLKEFRLFWIQAVFVRSGLWFEFYFWKVILPLLALGYYLLFRLIRLFKKSV
ncbi:MAG: hypothetical protein HQL14_00090 [Candidatus Omnitrophica bacterium]|nr:hypothetical protein [Candidatus Omnitrophota bacterium]